MPRHGPDNCFVFDIDCLVSDKSTHIEESQVHAMSKVLPETTSTLKANSPANTDVVHTAVVLTKDSSKPVVLKDSAPVSASVSCKDLEFHQFISTVSDEAVKGIFWFLYNLITLSFCSRPNFLCGQQH